MGADAGVEADGVTVDKPVNLKRGKSSASAPVVPPAPPAAAAPAAEARWGVFLPMERESALVAAGWKKGSPGLADMMGKPWADMTGSQRTRIASAIDGKSVTPDTTAESSPAAGQQLAPGTRVTNPKPSPAVKADTPAPAGESTNTLVTDDAAERARAILRKKLGGTLNSGIDPELLQAGITLAAYHVERGARKFAAYARAMVDDLGDMVKPYLQSWYMAMRSDPAYASLRPDMDKASIVEELDIEQVLAAGPAD